MKEMDELRALVLAQKGKWSLIANITGLNIKTLSRIANGGTPDVRLKTATLVREAIKRITEPVELS